MKQCTYCGKEYPDEAEVCAIDQNPLPSDTPDASAPLKSRDRLGISLPNEPRLEYVPRSFCMLTFFGMVTAAMFFVVLLGGAGANLGALLIGVPLFPVGLLVGFGKVMSWHKSAPLTSQSAINALMLTPYIAYTVLFFAFCLIRKWRSYWVGLVILFCLLLMNVAGCHMMLKQSFRGPE
jgi:hypothetical protein